MEPLIPVKAVAFDCFGTLVQVTRPSHVYRELISRMPKYFQPPAKTAVMSNPWTLTEAAHQLGVQLTAPELLAMEERLADELSSVECFPETRAVLLELQSRGYRLSVCSNLAMPFAAPVEALLGKYFDTRIWSFEAGVIKPDRRIFTALCDSLELPPAEILLVGDSLASDFQGARASGLHARHLTREVPAARVGLNRIATLSDVLRLVS
jgi:HAD superfamily hydrolase (TIGR01509 family)